MTRRHKLAIKSISLLLTFTFIFSELSYAGALEGTGVFQPAPTPKELILRDPTRFEAPIESTVLKEIHQGDQGTFIIHIQDAHVNYSGQQNLANALDVLMSKYKIGLVLVEGGTRDDTLTPIKEVAPPEVWKKVAKRFLLEGKISGEEYLNLTSDHPMKIMGIENKELYMKSVKAYGDLAGKRAEILEYLKKIQYAVNKLKRKLYPEELLDYEKERGEANFEGNFKGLLNLVESHSIDIREFPVLQTLREVQKKESEINFDIANLEQAALVEEIAKKAPDGIPACRQAGLAASLARDDKTNKVSLFCHFQNTLNIAKSKNISLEKYPNLILYLDYLKQFSDLDLDRVLDELEKAEDKVYRSVLSESNSTGDAEAGRPIRSERTIVTRERMGLPQRQDPSNLKTAGSAAFVDAALVRSIDRYLGLLVTAYQIKMTTKEFNLFKVNEPDFSTVAYQAFVNRKLAEFGYFDDLIEYKNILDDGKKALEEFYDSVNQRDFEFIKNTERILKEENQKIAFLISGGYHTPHLKKLFKEKGYSYAVLSPIVTGETNQAKYEKLLLESVRKETKKVETVQGQTLAGEKSLSALEEDLIQLQKKSDGVRPEAIGDDGVRLAALVNAAKPSTEEGSRLAAEVLLRYVKGDAEAISTGAQVAGGATKKPSNIADRELLGSSTERTGFRGARLTMVDDARAKRLKDAGGARLGVTLRRVLAVLGALTVLAANINLLPISITRLRETWNDFHWVWNGSQQAPSPDSETKKQALQSYVHLLELYPYNSRPDGRYSIGGEDGFFVVSKDEESGHVFYQLNGTVGAIYSIFMHVREKEEPVRVDEAWVYLPAHDQLAKITYQSDQAGDPSAQMFNGASNPDEIIKGIGRIDEAARKTIPKAETSLKNPDNQKQISNALAILIKASKFQVPHGAEKATPRKARPAPMRRGGARAAENSRVYPAGERSGMHRFMAVQLVRLLTGNSKIKMFIDFDGTNRPINIRDLKLDRLESLFRSYKNLSWEVRLISADLSTQDLERVLDEVDDIFLSHLDADDLPFRQVDTGQNVELILNELVRYARQVYGVPLFREEREAMRNYISGSLALSAVLEKIKPKARFTARIAASLLVAARIQHAMSWGDNEMKDIFSYLAFEDDPQAMPKAADRLANRVYLPSKFSYMSMTGLLDAARQAVLKASGARAAGKLDAPVGLDSNQKSWPQRIWQAVRQDKLRYAGYGLFDAGLVLFFITVLEGPNAPKSASPEEALFSAWDMAASVAIITMGAGLALAVARYLVYPYFSKEEQTAEPPGKDNLGARMANMSRRSFLTSATLGVPAYILLRSNAAKAAQLLELGLRAKPLPFPSKPVPYSELPAATKEIIQFIDEGVRFIHDTYLVSDANRALRFKSESQSEAAAYNKLVNVVHYNIALKVMQDLVSRGEMTPAQYQDYVAALNDAKRAQDAEAVLMREIIPRYFAQYGIYFNVAHMAVGSGKFFGFYELRPAYPDKDASIVVKALGDREVKSQLVRLSGFLGVFNPNFPNMAPFVVHDDSGQIFLTQELFQFTVDTIAETYLQLLNAFPKLSRNEWLTPSDIASSPSGFSRSFMRTYGNLFMRVWKDFGISLNQPREKIRAQLRDAIAKILLEENLQHEAVHIYDRSVRGRDPLNYQEGVFHEIRGTVAQAMGSPNIRFSTLLIFTLSMAGRNPFGVHGQDYVFIRNRLGYLFWQTQLPDSNKRSGKEIHQFSDLPEDERDAVWDNFALISDENLKELYAKLWAEIQNPNENPFMRGYDVGEAVPALGARMAAAGAKRAILIVDPDPTVLNELEALYRLVYPDRGKVIIETTTSLDSARRRVEGRLVSRQSPYDMVICELNFYKAGNDSGMIFEGSSVPLKNAGEAFVEWLSRLENSPPDNFATKVVLYSKEAKKTQTNFSLKAFWRSLTSRSRELGRIQKRVAEYKHVVFKAGLPDPVTETLPPFTVGIEKPQSERPIPRSVVTRRERRQARRASADLPVPLATLLPVAEERNEAPPLEPQAGKSGDIQTSITHPVETPSPKPHRTRRSGNRKRSRKRTPAERSRGPTLRSAQLIEAQEVSVSQGESLLRVFKFNDRAQVIRDIFSIFGLPPAAPYAQDEFLSKQGIRFHRRRLENGRINWTFDEKDAQTVGTFLGVEFSDKVLEEILARPEFLDGVAALDTQEQLTTFFLTTAADLSPLLAEQLAYYCFHMSLGTQAVVSPKDYFRYTQHPEHRIRPLQYRRVTDPDEVLVEISGTLENAYDPKERPKGYRKIQILGDRHKMIDVAPNGKFHTRIILKRGETARFTLFGFNDEEKTRSDASLIEIKQTGKPKDLADVMSDLLLVNQEVRRRLGEQEFQRRYLEKQIARSLLKEFTEDEEKGFETLRRIIDSKANNPFMQSIYDSILKDFLAAQRLIAGELPDMKEPLYFYQKYAIYQIWQRMQDPNQDVPGVMLALAPGLGKTVIGLAIAKLSKKKTLVIAPNSLKTVWKENEEQFFPGSPQIVVAHGSDNEKTQTIEGAGADKIVVVNQEYLRVLNDNRRTKAMGNPPFGFFMLDEGQWLGRGEEEKGSLQVRGVYKINRKGLEEAEKGFTVLISATPFESLQRAKNVLRFLSQQAGRNPAALEIFKDPRREKGKEVDMETYLQQARTAHFLLDPYIVRVTEDDVFKRQDDPNHLKPNRLPRETLITPESMGNYTLTRQQSEDIVNIMTDYPGWRASHRSSDMAETGEAPSGVSNSHFEMALEIERIMDGGSKLEKLKEIVRSEVLDKKQSGTVFVDFREEQVVAYKRELEAMGIRVLTFYGDTEKEFVTRNGYIADESGRVRTFRLEPGKPPADDPGGVALTPLDYNRHVFQDDFSQPIVMIGTYPQMALGQTLTRADFVIHAGRPQSFTVEFQANKRAPRIDTKKVDGRHLRQKYEVRYYTLVGLYPPEFLKKAKEQSVVIDMATRRGRVLKTSEVDADEKMREERRTGKLLEFPLYTRYLAQGTLESVGNAKRKIGNMVFHFTIDGPGISRSVKDARQPDIDDPLSFLPDQEVEARTAAARMAVVKVKLAGDDRVEEVFVPIKLEDEVRVEDLLRAIGIDNEAAVKSVRLIKRRIGKHVSASELNAWDLGKRSVQTISHGQLAEAVLQIPARFFSTVLIEITDPRIMTRVSTLGNLLRDKAGLSSETASEVAAYSGGNVAERSLAELEKQPWFMASFGRELGKTGIIRAEKLEPLTLCYSDAPDGAWNIARFASGAMVPVRAWMFEPDTALVDRHALIDLAQVLAHLEIGPAVVGVVRDKRQRVIGYATVPYLSTPVLADAQLTDSNLMQIRSKLDQIQGLHYMDSGTVNLERLPSGRFLFVPGSNKGLIPHVTESLFYDYVESLVENPFLSNPEEGQKAIAVLRDFTESGPLPEKEKYELLKDLFKSFGFDPAMARRKYPDTDLALQRAKLILFVLTELDKFRPELEAEGLTAVKAREIVRIWSRSQSRHELGWFGWPVNVFEVFEMSMPLEDWRPGDFDKAERLIARGEMIVQHSQLLHRWLGHLHAYRSTLLSYLTLKEIKSYVSECIRFSEDAHSLIASYDSEHYPEARESIQKLNMRTEIPQKQEAARDYLRRLTEDEVKDIRYLDPTVEFSDMGMILDEIAAQYGDKIRFRYEITSQVLPQKDVLYYDLRDCLQNLIANAYNARDPERQLEMTFSAGVEKQENGSSIVLRISDNGFGMSRHRLGMVKKVLTNRLEKYTDKQIGQGGMGLQIIRKFVSTYGGSVAVQSRLKSAHRASGTVYTLRFPITPGTDGARLAQRRTSFNESRLATNAWMQTVYERSYGGNRGLAIAIQLFTKTSTPYSARKDVPFRLKIIEDIRRLSEEEVLQLADQALNIFMRRYHKHIFLTKQGAPVPYYERHNFTVREIFLHPTIGGQNLGGIDVNQLIGTIAETDYINDELEEAERTGDSQRIVRLRMQVWTEYLLLAAIEILSRKEDLALIQAQDVEDGMTQGELLHYLLHLPENTTGASSKTPPPYVENLFKLTKLFLPPDYQADQRVNSPAKMEALKNFLALIRTLQSKQNNAWEEFLRPFQPRIESLQKIYDNSLHWQLVHGYLANFHFSQRVKSSLSGFLNHAYEDSSLARFIQAAEGLSADELLFRTDRKLAKNSSFLTARQLAMHPNAGVFMSRLLREKDAFHQELAYLLLRSFAVLSYRLQTTSSDYIFVTGEDTEPQGNLVHDLLSLEGKPGGLNEKDVNTLLSFGERILSKNSLGSKRTHILSLGNLTRLLDVLAQESTGGWRHYLNQPDFKQRVDKLRPVVSAARMAKLPENNSIIPIMQVVSHANQGGYSPEALNRMKNERRRGITRWRVDLRLGQVEPISRYEPSAVDWSSRHKDEVMVVLGKDLKILEVRTYNDRIRLSADRLEQLNRIIKKNREKIQPVAGMQSHGARVVAQNLDALKDNPLLDYGFYSARETDHSRDQQAVLDFLDWGSEQGFFGEVDAEYPDDEAVLREIELRLGKPPEKGGFGISIPKNSELLPAGELLRQVILRPSVGIDDTAQIVSNILFVVSREEYEAALAEHDTPTVEWMAGNAKKGYLFFKALTILSKRLRLSGNALVRPSDLTGDWAAYLEKMSVANAVARHFLGLSTLILPEQGPLSEAQREALENLVKMTDRMMSGTAYAEWKKVLSHEEYQREIARLRGILSDAQLAAANAKTLPAGTGAANVEPESGARLGAENANRKRGIVDFAESLTGKKGWVRNDNFYSAIKAPSQGIGDKIVVYRKDEGGRLMIRVQFNGVWEITHHLMSEGEYSAVPAYYVAWNGESFRVSGNGGEVTIGPLDKDPAVFDYDENGKGVLSVGVNDTVFTEKLLFSAPTPKLFYFAGSPAIDIVSETGLDRKLTLAKPGSRLAETASSQTEEAPFRLLSSGARLGEKRLNHLEQVTGNPDEFAFLKQLGAVLKVNGRDVAFNFREGDTIIRVRSEGEQLTAYFYHDLSELPFARYDYTPEDLQEGRRLIDASRRVVTDVRQLAASAMLQESVQVAKTEAQLKQLAQQFLRADVSKFLNADTFVVTVVDLDALMGENPEGYLEVLHTKFNWLRDHVGGQAGFVFISARADRMEKFDALSLAQLPEDKNTRFMYMGTAELKNADVVAKMNGVFQGYGVEPVSSERIGRIPIQVNEDNAHAAVIPVEGAVLHGLIVARLDPNRKQVPDLLLSLTRDLIGLSISEDGKVWDILIAFRSLGDEMIYSRFSIKAVKKLNIDQFLEYTRLVLAAVGVAA